MHDDTITDLVDGEMHELTPRCSVADLEERVDCLEGPIHVRCEDREYVLPNDTVFSEYVASIVVSFKRALDSQSSPRPDERRATVPKGSRTTGDTRRSIAEEDTPGVLLPRAKVALTDITDPRGQADHCASSSVRWTASWPIASASAAKPARSRRSLAFATSRETMNSGVDRPTVSKRG